MKNQFGLKMKSRNFSISGLNHVVMKSAKADEVEAVLQLN